MKMGTESSGGVISSVLFALVGKLIGKPKPPPQLMISSQDLATVLRKEKYKEK